MKTTLILFFLAIGISFAKAQPLVQTGAEISVNKTTHDYGSVKIGSDGFCEFIITNTGNEPLIISDARGSCSCTVPEWTKDPIAPGASTTIKVKYNTNNPGPINKSVTIMSNAVSEPVKTLKITGNVLPAAEGTSPVDNSGAPTITQ